jgi:osmotically inducible protein OsmC
MKRNATAVWHGTGKEGSGTISTQSGVLQDSQYGFKSRFEEGIGTNPEELIAAAHAGCFTMKLSFNISGDNLKPDELTTTANVNLNPDKGEIDTIELQVKARVPGLSQDRFEELVNDAKTNCPVSKLFKAAISVKAELITE